MKFDRDETKIGSRVSRIHSWIGHVQGEARQDKTRQDKARHRPIQLARARSRGEKEEDKIKYGEEGEAERQGREESGKKGAKEKGRERKRREEGIFEASGARECITVLANSVQEKQIIN